MAVEKIPKGTDYNCPVICVWRDDEVHCCTNILFPFPFFLNTCIDVWSFDQLWPMNCCTCTCHYLCLADFLVFWCLCSLWFLNMWVGVLLSILVNLLAVTFPNIASVPCCISSFFWYSSYIKPLGIPVLCPICFVVVFSMCFSFFYWPTLEFHKHVFCLIQADVKTHLKS